MKHFDYPFGLEEEFFLSHADTGALAVDVAGTLLDEARCELGDFVTTEMLQSQIEITSPIFSQVDEAYKRMSTLRSGLADVAAGMGLNLVAAGTHPLGVWQDQLVVDDVRYEQLMADFRIVGHRNLVCGLHVHVAIPKCVDRVEVMNRVMRWLPLFLALSTSSPFWNGRVTGLLSYRQSLYDEWPRSGIPDFFENESDYAAFADRMTRAGAIRDASQLWWAIRPALRYPTLELRIADACTYVEDSVAIAALFRCLVAATVRRPRAGTRHTTHTRRIIDENRWRAKRDGLAAQFIAEASSEVLAVPQVLEAARLFVSEDANQLQCATALQGLHTILERGTSAHRQLKIYNDARAAGASRAEGAPRGLGVAGSGNSPKTSRRSADQFRGTLALHLSTSVTGRWARLQLRQWTTRRLLEILSELVNHHAQRTIERPERCPGQLLQRLRQNPLGWARRTPHGYPSFLG